MDEAAFDGLDIEVLTITLNRTTGAVEVNHEGMNYLEAIGVLTVALNQVQDTPFDLAYHSEDDDDEDF